MSATLAELAARFGCELRGNPDLVVDTVGTLTGAGANAVSFLANPLYRSELSRTNAAAVILEERFQAGCAAAALVTANPYATYARVAEFLHPPRLPVPGIHPSAWVAEDARVPESVEIGPLAVVGRAACLGESVVIGPGAIVGEQARIGEGTRLLPRATILERVVIGARCVIHSGVIIGADGFGFAQEEGAWTKVPQLGSVMIGDDVEIGANTTIDRGTIEDTVIDDGVKLDNLIQIGHNVRIGDHTVMAALCGISGSTRIGRRCMIAGAVVMVGHIEICDDVLVTFHSTVTRSIARPGTFSGALPADEAKRWRRNAARFRSLDEAARRQPRERKDEG
jgi:UDP-3-O-[3-hydroxymyristoyl] glucosamine N-acyltransferase